MSLQTEAGSIADLAAALRKEHERRRAGLRGGPGYGQREHVLREQDLPVPGQPWRDRDKLARMGDKHSENLQKPSSMITTSCNTLNTLYTVYRMQLEG